jgi:hypothetical protein
VLVAGVLPDAGGELDELLQAAATSDAANPTDIISQRRWTFALICIDTHVPFLCRSHIS